MAIQNKNWFELDRLAKTSLAKGGRLREFIDPKRNYSKLEHILALRSDPDEDGIWHDDGTRDLAFSLSLNPHFESVRGGQLGFRHKSSREVIEIIGTQPLGNLIIFQTGAFDYEHKTHAVAKQERLVLAGWLSY